MRGRVILSLCDLTGNWSEPYRLAGCDVRCVDLATGQDVRLLEYPGTVHGILAAPPCTMFASSGARWVRTREQMLEALSVVDACLRLVAVCNPAWWVLENPVGKLRRYLGSRRCGSIRMTTAIPTRSERASGGGSPRPCRTPCW